MVDKSKSYLYSKYGRNEFCLFRASSFQVLLYRDNALKYLVQCQLLALLFSFLVIYDLDSQNILPVYIFFLSVSVDLGPEDPSL